MGQGPWYLFIDESGNFDDLKDEVCVAGVLAPIDLPLSRLEIALAKEAPWIQWPIHSADLNITSFIFLSMKQYTDRVMSSGNHNLMIDAPTLEMERVYRKLKYFAPEEVERVVSALKSENMPLIEDLERIDQLWKRRSSMEWGEWRDRRNQIVSRFVSIYRAWACEVGAVGVLAGETHLGDAVEKGERYIELLETLLERASALLDADDEALHVTALTRYVHARPFTREDLAEVCAAAQGEGAPPLMARGTPGWGPDTCAALVFADALANRARHALRRRPSLKRLEADIERLSGLSITSNERPCAAASGDARAYLRATPERRPTLDAQGARRWACEQARAWAEGAR